MTDVRDFGAVGDGVADDTDAILHAVEMTGGQVAFPTGTYRIVRPIEVRLADRGPIALTGADGTARLVMAGEGPAIRLLGTHAGSANPDDFRPEEWLRERFPNVSGLEIVGENPKAEGIALDGTTHATIRHVLIRRCVVGVHLIRRNRNLLLADSHIYDGGPGAIGVYYDGVNLHQSNIVGCHISYCRHAGIKVQRSEVRNLQITGCDIEYNHDPDQPDSADVWIDAREGTVREGTIASCTIQAKQSPGGSNVRIEGPEVEGSKGTGLWTIAGNILQSQEVNLRLVRARGVAVTGNSFASGYERSLVLDDCRHVAVSGCTFDHNPDYGGDRIDGVLVRRSAGISLSGLILESVQAGDDRSGGAIEVVDSSEVSIQGCQVLDPAVRGIDLLDVRNSRVTACIVLDRRPEPTMREAIRLNGPGGGNLVDANLVGGSTGSDLAVAPGLATVVGNVTAERPGGER